MSTKRRNPDRHGSALVVLVVVLAVLGLVVAGAIRPVRHEADLATLRVETTRAFYASESGAVVLISAIARTAPMPAEGSELNLGGSRARFVQVPDSDGVSVIEGRSGLAVRRVELTTE